MVKLVAKTLGLHRLVSREYHCSELSDEFWFHPWWLHAGARGTGEQILPPLYKSESMNLIKLKLSSHLLADPRTRKHWYIGTLPRAPVCAPLRYLRSYWISLAEVWYVYLRWWSELHQSAPCVCTCTSFNVENQNFGWRFKDVPWCQSPSRCCDVSFALNCAH